MAHGCPVVSSNTSSMPEVIGQAGEYFNPSKPDEIKKSIELVVYDENRISKLKAFGSERLEHFSWAKCAEETRAVYRTLL
jgi:glycosyltransferase involved in cell wall biosynthesis